MNRIINLNANNKNENDNVTGQNNTQLVYNLLLK